MSIDIPSTDIASLATASAETQVNALNKFMGNLNAAFFRKSDGGSI